MLAAGATICPGEVVMHRHLPGAPNGRAKLPMQCEMRKRRPRLTLQRTMSAQPTLAETRLKSFRQRCRRAPQMMLRFELV